MLTKSKVYYPKIILAGEYGPLFGAPMIITTLKDFSLKSNFASFYRDQKSSDIISFESEEKFTISKQRIESSEGFAHKAMSIFCEDIKNHVNNYEIMSEFTNEHLVNFISLDSKVIDWMLYCSLCSYNNPIEYSFDTLNYVDAVVMIFNLCKSYKFYTNKKDFDIENKMLSIKIESDIPKKSGLGSSSTFLAAITDACVDYFELEDHIEIKWLIATSVENSLFHYKSSGGDIAHAFLQKNIIYKFGHSIIIKEFGLNIKILLSKPKESATKDCVKHVLNLDKLKHLKSYAIDLMNEIIIYLITNKKTEIISLLKKYHEFMRMIGVVGGVYDMIITKINEFYKDNEILSVVKVSGSGALFGKNPGLIIDVSIDE
jgi:mevalonate kinase